MRIVGIDPGSEKSAFVCWDTDKHDFYGERLGLCDNSELIDSFQKITKGCTFIACEMIQSYGLGVGRSTFETCLLVGVLIELSRSHCRHIKLFGRPAVKGAIGGRTDAEIRASLRLRYGESKKGEKLEGVRKDIWSALAVCVALEENPELKEW